MILMYLFKLVSYKCIYKFLSEDLVDKYIYIDEAGRHVRRGMATLSQWRGTRGGGLPTLNSKPDITHSNIGLVTVFRKR